MANIWSNAVMTSAGLTLLGKLVEGDTLEITRAQSGSGTVPVANLASQTAVTSPQQALTIRSVTAPEEGTAALSCYVTNESVATSYTAMQIGIFAQDPDDGEILFFICQADSGTGTVIPANTEMPGFTAEWTFYFSFGQADSVRVEVNPANTVSLLQVQQLIVQALETASFNASQITAGALPVSRGGTGENAVDTTPTSGSPRMVTSGGVYAALRAINASQITAGVLPVSRGGTGNNSVDSTPTRGSSKMVTSGGVYAAIQGINMSQVSQGVHSVAHGGTGYSTVDSIPTQNSERMVTSGGVYTQLIQKQRKITYGAGAPSGGLNGDVYIRYL